MLRAWLKTGLGILAGIGTVVGVTSFWGFYPVGTIMLLVVALVAALYVARDRQHPAAAATIRAPDPGERQHDARIVAEVRELVTRRNIEWLRTWDFGGSWRAALDRPLYDLNDLDDVEHRPIDEQLAAAFRELLNANGEFTLLLTQHSYPARDGDEARWRNVGWSGGEAYGLEGEQRATWEKRRDILNSGADPVVAAYDAFIDAARRKLLLDTVDQTI